MIQFACLLFVGFANLLLGILIFPKKLNSLINFYFSLVAISVCFWSIGVGMFLMSTNEASALIWVKIYYNAANLIALSLVLFSTVFPIDKKVSPLKIIGIATPSVLLLMYNSINPRFMSEAIVISKLGNIVILDKLDYSIFATYFLAYFGGYILLISYRYATASKYTKQRLLFMLVGVLVSGFFGMLFNLILPWFGNYYLIWIGPLFSIVNVILMFYAIRKYRLFDIRFAIRSILFKIVLSLFFSFVIFFSIKIFIGASIQVSSLNIFIASFIVSLIITTLYRPINRVIRNSTDSFLFQREHDIEELIGNFGIELVKDIDIDRIMNLVIKTLSQVTHSKTSYVFVKFKEDNSIQVWCKEQKELSTKKFEKLFELYLQQTKSVLTYEDLVENKEIFKLSDDFLKFIFDNKIELITRISSTDKFDSFLILGSKKDSSAYTSNDIKIIESLKIHIGIAVQNAYLYKSSQGFNEKLQSEIDKATKKIKESNEQLAASNIQLQGLDKLKDELVDVTSHELRTPSTIARNYLSVLLRNEGETLKQYPKIYKYIEIAYQNSERTIKLVNDILLVSKIEGNHLTIKPSRYDIGKLILNLVEEFGHTTQEKNVSISSELTEHLPEVYIDSKKVREVISNLIGNAIKYTPQNGKIVISAARKGIKNVIVSIKDTGPGISDEDKARLFKKFGRLEGSYKTVGEAGGTGLGLYICKNIVALHGGEIWVESDSGQGSTFSFSIPVYIDQPQIMDTNVTHKSFINKSTVRFA